MMTLPSQHVASLVRARIAMLRYPRRRLATEIGISETTLSQKINGKSAWSQSQLRRVSDVLGVDFVAIATREGEEDHEL